MSQFDFGTIDVVETNGTELAAMLQAFRTAIETSHSGNTRPDYIQAGMKWLDTSGATWLEKFWDGTDDLVVGTYDPTNHVYCPALHNWTAEVTIPSAATTDVLGADTNRVVVSGTNTITSFGTKKNTVKFVRFTGALTINNTTNIITGDGANLNVTAGSTLIVISDASGVARIWSAPSSGVPAGQVVSFAQGSAPVGYLKCNGAAVSRTSYAGLFAAIGTTYGVGDGSTTFNLPDLRGEFIRGLDDGRGVDTGRALGSAQAQSIQSHTHTGTADAAGNHSHSLTGSYEDNQDAGPYVGTASQNSWGTFSTSTAGAHTHNLSIAATGGTETRGRNVALLFCIKY
ncbi:tail fiber protein (plasmid) [Rhizobium bangladeshense]|uniref:tail fiber protein n=1 Tax=Rhizobium bangladeshense TaxID=1138189 RepID=UPI001A994C99|nr:tail fiber protein [Rhizobium bangladeshense]QSY98662.1 tail fiber protein [Rhizobium bangladeshense]